MIERVREAPDRGRELWLFDDAPILGGAELITLRLARHVLESRPDLYPRIVCPADSELAGRASEAGVETVPVRFPLVLATGVPRWPRAILRVRSLLAGAGEDAIAVGTAASAQAYLTAAAPLLRRGPAIVHLVAEQLTLARVSGRFAYRHVGSLVAFGDNVAAMFRERLPGVHSGRPTTSICPTSCRVRPGAALATGFRCLAWSDG